MLRTVECIFKYTLHLKCPCGLPGVNCPISLSLHIQYILKQKVTLSVIAYVYYYSHLCLICLSELGENLFTKNSLCKYVLSCFLISWPFNVMNIFTNIRCLLFFFSSSSETNRAVILAYQQNRPIDSAIYMLQSLSVHKQN